MRYQYQDIVIRNFTFEDIPLKIEWINNPDNNKYLHYDLPLEYEKTCTWFEKNKDNKNRFDGIIEYMGKPVGLIGLLNIDYHNLNAEEYIVIGNNEFKRKGIATIAGKMIEEYGFEELGLHRIYAYMEDGNSSLDLFLKKGFKEEGVMKEDIKRDDRYVDRHVVGLLKEEFIALDGVNKYE